jgi:hypothetical protein
MPVSALLRTLSASLSRDRSIAWLIGLHGLALMVAFPLGPQQSRLWHPGVPGVAALVAAFPIAAVVGGLVARRTPRLPVAPRTLALAGAGGMLAAVLSTDYATFFAARALAGLIAGLSVTALHRSLTDGGATPAMNLFASRVIACGMPLCVLAATLLDWRAVSLPICIGFALVASRSSRRAGRATFLPVLASVTREAAPSALVATGALAFVSSAYMTVLSGFLVYDAGHTELHIPLGLLIGAVLSLGIPGLLNRLKARLAPATVFTGALAFASVSLVSLLQLRSASSAALAVGLIGGFIAINSARHLGLAGVISPRLSGELKPAHQAHSYIAHSLGAGLGTLFAGAVIHFTPGGKLGGMEFLLVSGLAATALAWVTGLAAAQPTAEPAARAADAKSRWRVATSLVRLVRTSNTRTPGTPT